MGPPSVPPGHLPSRGGGREDLLQGLPPILPEGETRALILGSFPSVRSLESRQYYAHPQNWFWRVMQHCGVVADALAPYAERVEQIRSKQLAVWDLYARVRREGSGDDAIQEPVANPISEVCGWDIPILLNGRRLREFRRAFPKVEAELIALPSTSPRPLHWNTEESRSAAQNEWCSALSRSLGVHTLDG